MHPAYRTATQYTSYGQRGAALVVGLILLSIITMLSVSAMRSANLDARIAGNHQHKQLSFQAAENALAVLLGPNPGPVAPHTTPGLVKENGNYFVARGVAGQPDISTDLDMTFVTQTAPGEYKFSGYGLSITALIYQADSQGHVDGTKTKSHNRMSVALIR